MSAPAISGATWPTARQPLGHGATWRSRRQRPQPDSAVNSTSRQQVVFMRRRLVANSLTDVNVLWLAERGRGADGQLGQARHGRRSGTRGTGPTERLWQVRGRWDAGQSLEGILRQNYRAACGRFGQ